MFIIYYFRQDSSIGASNACMMQFLYTTAKLSKFGRDLRCGSIVAGGDLDTHNDVADDKEVLVGVGGGGDDVLEINFFFRLLVQIFLFLL